MRWTVPVSDPFSFVPHVSDGQNPVKEKLSYFVNQWKQAPFYKYIALQPMFPEDKNLC